MDFDYVFTNASFENNLSIYFTLILLIATYMLLMAYAMWADARDKASRISLPLSDNDKTVAK